MWWPVVFWILLVPLVIVEFILFLKTRKFSWLIYALAIFTYVIAVTYTIDVFDLGKNAVILVLLASSGLMVLLGRRMRAAAPREIKGRRIAAIALGSLMLIVFAISAIFGRLEETVQPATEIRASQIVIYPDSRDAKQLMEGSGVIALNKTYTNRFFLPVPVPLREYRACVMTSEGVQDAGGSYDYRGEHPEVTPGQTRVVPLRVSQVYLSNTSRAQELRIYPGGRAYVPCFELQDREPLYRVQIV